MAKSPCINPFDRSFRNALDATTSTNQSLPNNSPFDSCNQTKNGIDGVTRSHSFSFFPNDSTIDSVPINGCGDLAIPGIELKAEHSVSQIIPQDWERLACPQTNQISNEPNKPFQRLPSNLSLLRCESVEEFLRMNNLTLGSSSNTNLVNDFAHSFVGIDDTTVPGSSGLLPNHEGVSQSLITHLTNNESSLYQSVSKEISEAASSLVSSTSDDYRFTTLVRLLSTICSDLTTHLRNLPTLPISNSSNLPINSAPPPSQIISHHSAASKHASETLDAACLPSDKTIQLSDSYSTDPQAFQHLPLAKQKVTDVQSRKRPFPNETHSNTENLDRDNLIARLRQRCGATEAHKTVESESATEREGENDSQRLDSVSISCSDSSGLSFLERNRMAARKARRKKKLYTQELEREHSALKKSYNKLKNRCDALKKENNNLRLVMSQLLQEKIEVCRDAMTPIESSDSNHHLISNSSIATGCVMQVPPTSHPTINSNASLLLMTTPSSEHLEHLRQRELNDLTHTVNNSKNYPRYIIVPQQVDKSNSSSNQINSAIGSSASLCVLSSTVEAEPQFIGCRPH